MPRQPVTPKLAAPSPSRADPRSNTEQVTLVISSNLHDILTIAEIQKAARKRKWGAVHLALTEGEIPQNIVPGCAIISDASTQDPLYRRLKHIGCFVVNLNSSPYGSHSVQPTIQDDFQAEGRLAAEHFAERGFRAVGFPVWLPNEPTLRFESFQTLASELGCSCHPLIFNRMTTKRGESIEHLRRRRYAAQLDQFRKGIQGVPRPIGLACPTDYLGARYAYMATQCGLRVPQDIAILGRGNIPHICECSPVNLSSICINTPDRIAAAFQLLDDMLAGRAAPTEPILISAHGITVRASTDIRAASDPNITEALTFIWSHYKDVNMSVDDVAEAAGCSRRKLEQLFRSELDETINDVLRNRRMEICQNLLITTDLPITDLCHHIGLRSKKHLHRIFKQVNGMTPRQYRVASRRPNTQKDF